MKQSNELLLGGIAPDKFDLLATAARSLGEATGTDAKTGMEQLSDSLLRGNDRALKSLGITIDNEKAFRDFAASIGTTSDKLNEQGKVIAIRNASLQALADNTEKLGKATLDAGDRINQITTSLSNLRDDLLRDISKDAGINKALSDLVDTIRNIDFNQFKNDIILVTTTLINFVNDGVKVAIKALNTLSSTISAFKGTNSEVNLAISSQFIEDAVDVEKEMLKITDLLGQDLPEATQRAAREYIALSKLFKAGLISLSTQEKTIEQMTRLRAQLGDAIPEAEKLFGATKELSKGIDQSTNSFKDFVGPVQKGTDALKKNKDQFIDSGKTALDAKKKLDDLKKANEDYTESIRKLLGQSALPSANKQLVELATNFYEGATSAEDTKKKLDELRKSFGNSPEDIKKFQSAVEETFKSTEDSIQNAEEEFDKFKQKFLDNQKEIQDASHGGGLFGGLFDGLFGNDANAIKQGRDLGDAISNSITSALADGLQNGFTRKGAANFLGSIGKDIAHSKGLDFLSPLIDVGSNLLGDALEHIFGGESAGLKARKAADKFFADAFDANRLGVIVDGQLKEITDLVFKGDTLFGGNVDFTDGSFSKFFDSLPDKAREAFGGVGAAFEELLGVGDDIGGQLAAVFANNVGGSLNNLQLLVKASGKSFEELSDSVVKAFNNGKLTALQAQSALQGIANVAQDGIPDGIGFTVQAFQNLVAAGTKGGATLIDAIKDIGFEAKEIGIKDFGALQANLAASGKFTAEEISQLFQSLRDHGITSIDQLTKATDTQLIPVLAQLEAQKFPFAEAANDANDLITQINDLPNEKTLTFNIKTNFDANTKAAQDQGYIPAMSNVPSAGNAVGLS